MQRDHTWLDQPRASAATRLVSFNIRNGLALSLRHLWWRRRRAVLESLQRLDADLVGLQEAYAFQSDWLCQQMPAYGWYGVGRTDGARRGEHAIVLYRQDRYLARRAETRWYGDKTSVPGTKLPGARFPRTATILDLEARDGTALRIVNTHLDAANPGNRLRSATQLASWVAAGDMPVVVVGDLNEGLNGPAVKQLAAELGLVTAVPATAGGSYHHFTGRTDGPRLDHILVPGSWPVQAAGIDHRPARGRLASDHWPVVADVLAGVSSRTSP